jgi:hypothetical protein
MALPQVFCLRNLPGSHKLSMSATGHDGIVYPCPDVVNPDIEWQRLFEIGGKLC